MRKDILPVLTNEPGKLVRQAWNEVPDYSHFLTQVTSPAVLGATLRIGQFLAVNPVAADFLAGNITVASGVYLTYELLEKIFQFVPQREDISLPHSSGVSSSVELSQGAPRPVSTLFSKPFSGPKFPRFSFPRLALRFGT